MKIYRLIYLLILMLGIGGNSVQAEARQEDGQGLFYGKVYELNSEKLYIVISDMNLEYTRKSNFYDIDTHKMSNVRYQLKIGTPVKFNFDLTSTGSVLKTLKVISKREFDQSDKVGVKLE